MLLCTWWRTALVVWFQTGDGVTEPPSVRAWAVESKAKMSYIQFKFDFLCFLYHWIFSKVCKSVQISIILFLNRMGGRRAGAVNTFESEVGYRELNQLAIFRQLPGAGGHPRALWIVKRKPNFLEVTWHDYLHDFLESKKL